MIQELFLFLKGKEPKKPKEPRVPWLANRNPRANSLDKLSISRHSGLLLRAHQGLQCIKQMVTSPKPQQGCPNSRNMGSLPDAQRSPHLWQELQRKELYCKANQCRRQGIKSLFNPGAWVQSKGVRGISNLKANWLVFN